MKNHAEKEVKYLVETFTELGLSDRDALIASHQVAQARYSEALIHSIGSSRVDYWEQVLDALNDMQ